jgi:hypothetical protein
MSVPIEVTRSVTWTVIQDGSPSDGGALPRHHPGRDDDLCSNCSLLGRLSRFIVRTGLLRA